MQEVSEAVSEWTCHLHYDPPPVSMVAGLYGVDVAGLYGVDVAGLYGVDMAGRGPVGWCGVDMASPTTLTPP